MNEDLFDMLRKPTDEEKHKICKELYISCVISFNIWKLLFTVSLVFIPAAFWDNYLMRHDIKMFIDTALCCLIMALLFYFLNTLTRGHKFIKAMKHNRLRVEICTCLSTTWASNVDYVSGLAEEHGQVIVRGTLTGDIDIKVDASADVMRAL